MDLSDVGRLGALQLLRKQSPESVVTSYPIDDEEITIGRDQSCSLRLYYPAVSAVHAKITFVDRKAFLVIIGTNGVLLDDEPMFPAPANAHGPTTVPLQNNSVIEIHKKRFRFIYPPKHLRSALINTPTQMTPAGERRPLRLSMIATAQVFTPRPSHDPQENLRVLQTPLRTPFAQELEEIVLVQSNTPRVVEEEKDLVILDEVEPEPVLPLPLPMMPQYPATPVRRPRASLHRAVLIRSAQRAVLQREIQREEEEQEAEEVEDVIDAIAEESDEDVQEIPPPEGHQQVSGWRKSLDAVKGSLGWAFRGLSVEPKEEEEEPTLDEEFAHDITDGQDEEMVEEIDYNYEQPEEDYQEQENEYEYQDERDDTLIAEPPRPLGQFMTPQIPWTSQRPRLSLGVGAAPDSGPRRVRVVAPWKVNEIQVPAIKEEDSQAPSASGPTPLSTPRSLVKREKVTEEEREAIRARRRSALATPDNFFKGQTPGSRRTLFPSLAPLPSPSFGQPASSSSSASVESMLAASTSTSSTASTTTINVKEEEEKEDTAVLLARMKQMVEGVKQRQSLGRQSLSLSPRKREGGFSLLAPDHARPHRPSHILLEEEDEGDGSTHMDEGQEQESERPAHGQNAPAPATPHMADLRHVFGRPRGESQTTPVLAGVREMFRPQPQRPETPRMDGMQEILSTPAAYRAPAITEDGQEEEDVHEEEQPEEQQEEPVEELPAKITRGKRAPATRIARKAPTPVPQSAPSKSTRAASLALDQSEPEGRTARRTRARTADGAVGQIPRATRGKAAAKPVTPEPKEDEDEPESLPTRAGRRTRTTTDSSTTSITDDADTKPPARKTRAKTPTPATATKAGTTRRGTRAKPIEVNEEEDDDPLDSLPRERATSNTSEHTKGRRGARSKSSVKQEETEDVVPPLPTAETDAPRTTRGRRTPVPRTTPVPTTGRGIGATRTRGAAAASSAVVEAAIPEDKENTPESNGDDDGEEGKAAPSTKARKGTRSAAAGRSAGKNAVASSDASEEPTAAVPPAATKTRASRARAAKA
ncbi:hypothetical protein DICSQDRAFT_105472 [Dichomitus squalens LYAD-421 SS1]|uniref:FHA domain-containing protein n=2 Tax=Dichomitus squalens TaxID=114155 RepID=A0A4Q9Q7E6_9APHY|nr:uncharacterized protein DICSQDRAFT_105472 [Dichomitus squalens LYAD-421 SS1]EJF61779.1 hypothetical protein DICSQDRAFT_105472 [Dichomitus squalens LYAD-421 SS1]TBU63453.1 hypothetical protein BD310DRAFT_841488 [Dichomitus squalens]